MSVWLDAAWAAPGFYDPPIPFDPADRGLMLADGAFDTALVLSSRMVWREHHVARLVAACATLGFALDAPRVERAIDALLVGMEHGSLRLTATRGPAPRGVAPPPQPSPTLLATAAPLRGSALFAPLRLQTTVIRRNDSSPLSRIKSLAYADAVHAVAAAARAGADDALFLNTRGAVACAGTANVLIVADGCLATPPLGEGALDGIARHVLLACAAEAGLTPVERPLLPAELRSADAVLATSSLRLVAPVASLDGHPLANHPTSVSRLVDAVARRLVADGHCDPRDLARAAPTSASQA